MADESWKVNMAVINSRSKFSFFNKVRVLLKKILKPDERIDDVVDEHFRFTSSLSLDAPDGIRIATRVSSSGGSIATVSPQPKRDFKRSSTPLISFG